MTAIQPESFMEYKLSGVHDLYILQFPCIYILYLYLYVYL